MDDSEGGEPLGVVPSEVSVKSLVGVKTEELTYDLDGEDLRVGELRSGAAFAQGSPVFELVIHQAEDGEDDEGAKIHGKRPPSRFGWFGHHRA